MSLAREERVALIERDIAEVPVTRQADLRSLARSSLY